MCSVMISVLWNILNISFCKKKVQYEPVIQTPDVPAKFEVRMMYIWEKDSPRPRLVINLVRLSKGVMIGVNFNKNKDWVGGSVGFFE